MAAIKLSELADLAQAVLEGDGERVVTGVASLAEAGPEDVSFLVGPRYLDQLSRTRAGAVLLPVDLAVERADLALLRCPEPGRAFSRVVQVFAAPFRRPARGVHSSAVVESRVELGEGAAVGPFCFIGEGARIGAGAVLYSHVVVGTGAEVGDDTELFPGVTLYPHVRVGARCRLHANAVVGADGFGFTAVSSGWEKVPQGGTVVIEDDVELGANSTVDRARIGATRIGRGSKIDNLVHVGHNVRMGAGCLLAGQSGIAGSAQLGEGVVLGGQAGVGGHLVLGDGARVAGQAGVLHDVDAGTEVAGYPAVPVGEQLRIARRQRRLGQLFEEVRDLKRRLERLEREEP